MGEDIYGVSGGELMELCNDEINDCAKAQCEVCGVGHCICKRCVGMECEEQDAPSWRAKNCGDKEKRAGLNQCDLFDIGRGHEPDRW